MNAEQLLLHFVILFIGELKIIKSGRHTYTAICLKLNTVLGVAVGYNFHVGVQAAVTKQQRLR